MQVVLVRPRDIAYKKTTVFFIRINYIKNISQSFQLNIVHNEQCYKGEL